MSIDHLHFTESISVGVTKQYCISYEPNLENQSISNTMKEVATIAGERHLLEFDLIDGEEL